jgi:hypothetical protein
MNATTQLVSISPYIPLLPIVGRTHAPEFDPPIAIRLPSPMPCSFIHPANRSARSCTCLNVSLSRPGPTGDGAETNNLLAYLAIQPRKKERNVLGAYECNQLQCD